MSEENNISGDAEEAVKDQQEQVEVATEQPKENSNEIDQLKSQLDLMQERLQKQSAIIGKLTNEKKHEADEEPKNESKPQGEISKYSELEEKLDNFQQRIQKQERAAKLNAIELALIEAGANTGLAKTQAEFFAYKLNERITSVEDDNGNINIQIADTNGESTTVNSWAKAFIGSDEGAYLRANKTGPSVNNSGDAGGQAQRVKLNSVEYSKQYALADMKGADAVNAFVASHSME